MGEAGDSSEAGAPRSPRPVPPSQTELEEFLRRQLPRLAGFVRRRAGALLNKESGSDLVQSVCREVLADFGAGKLELRGETPFQRWLYQAALLKLRDRRRYWAAEQRAADLRAPAAASAADHAARAAWLSSVASPSGELLRQEELAVVEACFAQLEPRQREVLELSRLEGKSHAEIAAQLSISEANSRMLLSRALARLTTLAQRKLPRRESP